MAPSTLKVPQNSDGAVECWDDDDELHCYEDIQLRVASSTPSITNSSIRRSGHRDSISSRRSARSDLDSAPSGDEDWQVQLLDDDELVNEAALTSVKNTGIPLPANVPRAALVGGTIKRLGRKKTKREFIDDWSDDLELPIPSAGLELKRFHDTSFPEAPLQIGSTPEDLQDPSLSVSGDPTRQSSGRMTSNGHLQTHQDENDADFVEDFPTIRASKQHGPPNSTIVSDSDFSKESASMNDFEDDFELPANDSFRLRHPSARITSPNPEDIDVDWSEGSIGVRFGGTARDHRSNPSSSISVVSPSASSFLTGESDDEGLDGLVIPDGPLNLGERLSQSKKASLSDKSHREPDGRSEKQSRSDDFLSGLEIGGNEAFNSHRPTINPNIKCRTEPLESPARRSATTLTFTNAAASPKSRIPRLSGHERTHSTYLETVSESGAPLSKFRASPRRPGHVSHSSVSSLPVSGSTIATPPRRLVGTRISKEALSGEGAAGKHSLKAKRSMPSMRKATQSPTINSLPSPPRRSGSSWLNTRLWASADGTGFDGKLSARKSQLPFVPAGASEEQSHHASVKNHRYSRRKSSDGTSDTISSQGTVIRLPRLNRHETPGSNSNDITSEALSKYPRRTLTRPARRRYYGDGTELASFDDLPTSTAMESKFVKQVSGRGAPRSLRNKLSISPSASKAEGITQQELAASTPPPQPKVSTPRFARDTNASRNAREQRIASMSSISKLRENSPLTPLSSNWKTQSVSRIPSSAGSMKSRKGKGSVSGSRPQLIKPIGAEVQERKCKLFPSSL